MNLTDAYTSLAHDATGNDVWRLSGLTVYVTIR